MGKKATTPAKAKEAKEKEGKKRKEGWIYLEHGTYVWVMYHQGDYWPGEYLRGKDKDGKLMFGFKGEKANSISVINWQNVSHFSSPAQLLHLMPDEKKRQKVEKNEDWKLTLKAAKKWLKGRPPTEKEEPTATLRAGDRILYLAPGTGPSQGHYREATICEVKSPKYMQQFGVALRLDSGDMLSMDDDVEAVDDDVEKDKVTLRVKQHRLIESVDHTIEDHEAKQRREDSKLKVNVAAGKGGDYMVANGVLQLSPEEQKKVSKKKARRAAKRKVSDTSMEAEGGEEEAAGVSISESSSSPKESVTKSRRTTLVPVAAPEVATTTPAYPPLPEGAITAINGAILPAFEQHSVELDNFAQKQEGLIKSLKMSDEDSRSIFKSLEEFKEKDKSIKAERKEALRHCGLDCDVVEVKARAATKRKTTDASAEVVRKEMAGEGRTRKKKGKEAVCMASSTSSSPKESAAERKRGKADAANLGAPASQPESSLGLSEDAAKRISGAIFPALDQLSVELDEFAYTHKGIISSLLMKSKAVAVKIQEFDASLEDFENKWRRIKVDAKVALRQHGLCEPEN